MTTATLTAPAPTAQDLKEQVLQHEELTGLVAPDGTFYDCEEYGHNRLMCQLFGEDYTYNDLVGWLHIGIAAALYMVVNCGGHALATHSKQGLTWAQEKVLDGILECEISDSLRTKIYYFLT